MDSELPVFDRRNALPAITDEGDWAPARPRIKTRGVTVRLPGDPPPRVDLEDASAEELDEWIKESTAWYSSNFYDGRTNDNADWPLQKLLRTEKNEHCLALAIRYRDLHDAATMPTQLVGREAGSLYVVHDQDEDGRDKGPKVVSGKRANIDTLPKRASVTSDETKRRASAVPKAWNGDWAILAAIDARKELAFLRSKLAFVPNILTAFEWSVVDGLTLEEVGKRLGAGSKGAKGEARARIFDGFGIVDRYWRQGATRKAANDNSPPAWHPGMPVPPGYYRSSLHPEAIFAKGQAAA